MPAYKITFFGTSDVVSWVRFGPTMPEAAASAEQAIRAEYGEHRDFLIEPCADPRVGRIACHEELSRAAGGRSTMEQTRTYKIGVITREDNGTSRWNWATHIDGSRRNWKTLRDAKRHIDRVASGVESDGLHVTKS